MSITAVSNKLGKHDKMDIFNMLLMMWNSKDCHVTLTKINRLEKKNVTLTLRVYSVLKLMKFAQLCNLKFIFVLPLLYATFTNWTLNKASFIRNYPYFMRGETEELS